MLKSHYYRDDQYQIEPELQARLGENHRVTVSKDTPQDTEVLILAYPTKEKLEELENLKALVIPFVGIPEGTRELMLNYPNLKVYNIHHNNRVAAEMVMAMLLTGIKHIIPADATFRKNDWSIRYGENPSTLLYQKKALICGMGHIGKLVARFLEPFGVKVDSIRKSYRNPQEGCYNLIDLPNIACKYDFIIDILPATKDTENVFNRQVFDKMKESCFFINIGRASTVVEEALYLALRDKTIMGAALDVWYNYPKSNSERSDTNPANLPFNKLDNLIMSPHRGGGLGMSENEQFRVDELVKLLNKIENDEEPRTIDLESGY